MKKSLLIFALFIGVTSFYNTAQAQHVNININIGDQPAWGPVGYDYVGYYYFPDIDCYYDVNVGMFYYSERGRWVSARYLPYSYRNYDLYGLHKVVLNVREPWRYHRNHYRDYARYRGHRDQIVIRDSRDYRYRDSRNNRVVWYSDHKASHRDNNYRNHNHHSNHRDFNRDSYNNRNDRDRHRGNDRHSSYNNENNNRRPTYDRNSRSVTRDNNRRNSEDSKVTRSTSSRSDFRMASNTDRDRRNR